ncbi:MAG: DNA repair protein RecO [Burkholderiales bacterium]
MKNSCERWGMVEMSDEAFPAAMKEGHMRTEKGAASSPVQPQARAAISCSLNRSLSRSHETQTAYVLHGRAYRETSLIVELFGAECGRVSVVARGAKRPKSPLRGALLPFQPLFAAWIGKSELRTLTRAEAAGAPHDLKGAGLLCGFYLNELLLKLLPKDDPHDVLFVCYSETLRALRFDPDPAPALRKFETRLLRETGYALNLSNDTESGREIDPDLSYTYLPERGPVALARDDEGPAIKGKTLLDMRQDDYRDPVTLSQAKLLMRFLITHHLSGRTLNTRNLFK